MMVCSSLGPCHNLYFTVDFDNNPLAMCRTFMFAMKCASLLNLLKWTLTMTGKYKLHIICPKSKLDPASAWAIISIFILGDNCLFSTCFLLQYNFCANSLPYLLKMKPGCQEEMS